MRIVVLNRQCVHLWAHQSQSHARSGSMSFSGDSIRSYSQEIARFVEGTKKRRAVIITTEDWSVTTSRHQSYVRSATSHLTQFFLPVRWIGYTGKGIVLFAFKYANDQIGKSLDKASRARTNKEWHLSCARQAAEQFNKIADFYGSKKRINLPADFDAMLAHARQAAEAQRKAESKRQNELAKQRAAEEERQTQEALASLEEWKAGRVSRIAFYNRLPDVYLRFITGGAEIQTSMGAEFPTSHGKRAYLILSRLNKRQEEYQRNGHTIHCGHFPIDKMDWRGIRAGCHFISWDSLNEFAQRAGWIDDGNDSPDNGTNGHTGESFGQNETAGFNSLETGEAIARESMDISGESSQISNGRIESQL